LFLAKDSIKNVPKKKKMFQLGTGGSHLYLAIQEAEIRRIAVQNQPRQIVHENLFKKKKITKKVWWSDSRYRP
jgi:hypothetical protein